MTTDPTPPRLPEWLRRAVPADLLGDLEESWRRRVRSGTRPWAATLWYLREIIRYLLRAPDHRPTSSPGTLDMLRQDVRYAFRSLLRRPAVSAVLVATLAIAIGANATIFGVVDSLFFATLRVERPERLVEIYSTSERDANVGGFQGFLPVSHPNFEDLRERASTLEGVYAYTIWPVSLEIGTQPERSQAMFVSGEYFSVLGVRPQRGRAFDATDDDVEGGSPIAVISHALWEERFGADPDAVGRSFRMNARSYTIVGVAPPGFRGTSATVGTDVWVPISMTIDIPVWGPLWQNRGARFFFLGARLAEGRTLAEVDAELDAVWAGLAEEHPTTNVGQGLTLVPMLEARVSPNVRGVVASASAVLLAVVGVLLLIACMNVANLMLARALGRGREMAIRTSIGAGRRRIVAQLLTESVVLFGVGGLVGLALAFWAQSALSGLQPPALFGATLEVRTDVRVVVFTAAVTMACGLLFGLIPAWRASRSDVSAQLRDGERGATSGGGHVLRNALVAGQVCLSLVALVGAGLFVRALGEASRVPLGFEPTGLTLLSVDLGAQGYDEAEGRLFHRQALDAVRALPGVESVALASVTPLTFGPLRRVLGESDDENDPRAGHMIRETVVSPGYAEAAGTTLLRGRPLRPSDDADATPVALVNDRMAAMLWPGEEAVGRTFRISLPPTEVTVAGVVETAKTVAIAEDPTPTYYLPSEQSYPPTATYFVRGGPGASGVAEQVRRALRSIDPSLPVYDVVPASFLVRQATWNTRAIALVLGAFGLIGLVLAAIGVYGVVSTSVRERTREIGLRMALGADASQTIRSVVGGTLAVAGLGVALGMVLAAVLTRPLSPQLFGVSSTDALTYASTAALLLGVAALASWLPARRAARVDPTEALRAE
jgi:predicted permease